MEELTTQASESSSQRSQETRMISKNTDRVLVELPVRTNIEKTAGGVIRSGTKCITIGEELDRIDVGFVPSECLNGLARTYIPELRKGIAGSRDKNVLVGRVDAVAHDIAEMVGKLGDLGACLHIPEHARHVTRGRQYATVVDEAAAGKIARMAGKFTSHTSRTFTRGEVVYRANIVESTTGDVVVARCIGASHYPRRSERNRVDLVGSVAIPNDEFAVLRS